MAMTLWSAHGWCVGGPWDGRFYNHLSQPDSEYGVFDYQGPGGVQGRYSHKGDTWIWEPKAESK